VSRARLAAFLLAGAFALTACGYADPYAASAPVANESPAVACQTAGADCFADGLGLPVNTYPDGLQYVDIKAGTGTLVHGTDIVTVQYTGWLSNGTKFDSSRNPGRSSFSVGLGQGQVIAGWDEGLPGMKVGGKRKLIIPPALGYGAAGQQDQQSGAYIIPPNETLVFEVEVLSLKPGPSPSPIPTPKPSPSPSPSK
jgi:hypothetical protein